MPPPPFPIHYQTIFFVAIFLQILAFVRVFDHIRPSFSPPSPQNFTSPPPAVLPQEKLRTQLPSRYPPPPSTPPEPPVETGECSSGRVFVYDLLPMFNQDLVNNCDKLDPWMSKCPGVSNDGCGARASEFDAIVPENLSPTMYWTDYYMGEIIYHQRLLNHKCRTLDPESASAFYIPFYAGIAVGRYFWYNHTAKERDWYPKKLLTWLKDQPYWKKSNGSDHIIMVGRITWDFRRKTDSDAEWGSKFLNLPEMENVVKISTERSPWDSLEISVPYPTSFHPRSDSDVREWQTFVRGRSRTSLFCFVGAARTKIKNDFRGLLLNQCLGEPGSCRFVDCSIEKCVDGTTAILEAFTESDFCLQPKGDGYTRRSVFDCLLAGSIPVYFWRRTAYEQYEPEWFLPGEPKSYSVFIDYRDVRNGTSVKKILQGYSREEVRRMREKVIEYIPRFLYAKPSQDSRITRDAVDIATEGVLTKYKDHMRGIKKEESTEAQ
ncbi:hypothetical protein NMG60_11005929 [Bertholletia excelsa]